MLVMQACCAALHGTHALPILLHHLQQSLAPLLSPAALAKQSPAKTSKPTSDPAIPSTSAASAAVDLAAASEAAAAALGRQAVTPGTGTAVASSGAAGSQAAKAELPIHEEDLDMLLQVLNQLAATAEVHGSQHTAEEEAADRVSMYR